MSQSHWDVKKNLVCARETERNHLIEIMKVHSENAKQKKLKMMTCFLSVFMLKLTSTKMKFNARLFHDVNSIWLQFFLSSPFRLLIQFANAFFHAAGAFLSSTNVNFSSFQNLCLGSTSSSSCILSNFTSTSWIIFERKYFLHFFFHICVWKNDLTDILDDFSREWAEWKLKNFFPAEKIFQKKRIFYALYLAIDF